jgi:hypothetical protein
MMTVDEQEHDETFKRMNSAYEQIVAALDTNKLDKEESFSLLAQILCQLAQCDRSDFLLAMDKFYGMERFLRPQPTEVH